jgi:hypothetical protein
VGKMASIRKKEPLCEDTLNSLTCQNKEFMSSTTYQWYSNLTLEQDIANKSWTTGLAKVGCMLEVFYFKELVSWCANWFNSKHRMIKVVVEGRNLILLMPKVFKKMLQLPTPNKSLRISDTDYFLYSQGSGVNLLKDFLESPSVMPDNTTHIHI